MKTDYNNDMEEALTEDTMLENTNPFDDEMEKQTVPEGAIESSTHSRWDDFLLTLKLLGIALAILSAIWGITYFQSG